MNQRVTPVSAIAIGGPTLLLRIGGTRMLIDPTFSPPGDYESGPGRFLTKLTGPALSADRVGDVDAVLLSHDQHVDNLDPDGRVVLRRSPIVLTTPNASERLGGNARGMQPWDFVDVHRPDGNAVRVTAVPALHGPEGSEPLTGEVTGFVLTAADIPTLYLSGDNASLSRVEEIARRFPAIDIAILFTGAAKSPKLLGDAYLTLSAAMAAQAAVIVGAPVVVPVHCEGWGHFTEGITELRAAFADAELGDRLVVLEPGQETQL